MVKGVVQEIFSYRTAEKGAERKHGSMHHAIPVFPMLLTGMTDSRWYHRIAPEKIIRFSPFSFNISRGDLSMLHGVNEKVPVEEYYDAVRFFSRLMYKSAVDKDQSWSTT
jgi:acetylornithine deacetylase/succinyl-diaminopimelate desuccinylase-like protein